MAKISGPLMSLNATGSLGGMTFARNRSGVYSRKRALPVKNRSSDISAYHYIDFRENLNEWTRLSPANRALWENFANRNKINNRFGIPYKASAFLWFMKLGLSARHWFSQALTTPPASLRLTYNPKISMQWTASGAEITFDTAIPSDHRIVVYNFVTSATVKLSHRKMNHWVLLVNGDTSPFIVTQPCDSGAGIGGNINIPCGTYVQFEVFIVSDFGVQSARLFFNLLSS